MNNNRIPSSSPDLSQANIEKLKELFPEIVTDGKVDFDMLKTVLGEEVDDRNERYKFEWHGKKESLLGSQQPSKGTLRPDKEASKNFDTTENLYIEGDNLEVLKLLQKSYNGKVKMIYIDPPYNTGKDFVYKDNFKNSVQKYLEQTGQVDSEGEKLNTNSESNGRFHTDWLNMVYPRLKLARNLLTDDGLIFISIADHENSRLKNICDEIYGENNFVANLVWANKEGGGSSDSKLFRIKHEYILCYAKNVINTEINGVDISNLDRYKETDEYNDYRGPFYLQKLGMGSIQYSSSLDYPIEAPDGSVIYPKDNNNGKKACWRWSREKFEKGLEKGFIVIKKDSKEQWTVYTKQYLKVDNEDNPIDRTQRPVGIIEEYSSTQAAKRLEKIGMRAYFNYSKPVGLLNYLLSLIDSEDCIVLDFFSGSGTTAEAVMASNSEDGGNRNFIMVQLPEPLEVESDAYKKGYKTICNIGEERIRRSGEKIKQELVEKQNEVGKVDENIVDPDSLDIGFKVLKLDKSNIREWNIDFTELEEQITSYDNMLIPGRTELDVVYEIMLKYGLELTYPINSFQVEGKNVYDIAFGNLFICLDENIDITIAQAIIDKRNEYGIETSSVVFADHGFHGNDSEKLNCFKLLEDAGYQNEQLMTI